MLRFPLSRAPGVALLLIASGTLMAQQPPGSGQSVRSTRTAAISGVATDGATGNGVPGVTVTLSVTGLPGAVATVTDSKGRFVFQNLPASQRCSIAASKPGFAGVSSLQRFPIINAGFALADGEWISDAKVVMWRLGGISGRVVDERGEPLVGVPVRVLTRIPAAGTVHWAAGPQSATDDRGVYRVAPLPRGNYVVSIPNVYSSVPVGASLETIAGRPPTQSAAFNPAPQVTGLTAGNSFTVLSSSPAPDPIGRTAYPAMYHPNATTLGAAIAIEVLDGEEKRNVDFTLRPASTVRVAGRITGSPEGLHGLVVRLLPEDAQAPGSGELATALVEASGAFVFAGVPAGQYRLEAATVTAAYHVGPSLFLNVPGAAARVSFRNLPWLPGDPLSGSLRMYQVHGARPMFADRALVVGGEDISSVELTLEPGATISGRVTIDDGSAFPRGLAIRADPATGDPRLVPADGTGLVNADGTFQIEGLRTGEYFLRASLPVKSIAADSDYTARPLAVSAGRDIAGVAVTLSPKIASLAGQVTDTKGNAVREAAVLLFPAESRRWSQFGLSPPEFKSVAFFGSQGYSIGGLRAGDYLAIAVDTSQQDAWQDPRFLAAAAAVATRVSIDWGAKVNQPLTLQRVVVK